MPKTVTMRIDDPVYQRLKAAAAAEHRSLANFIETAALRHLEESEFMEETEAQEILADRSLIARLRTGHAQARRRKGSFVRGL